MIKKAYAKLKSDGMGGLLKAVYRYILPKQVRCYRQVKSLFQSKVGLEIGGPSNIFGRRGYIPVYPIADRIDNCNFSSNTIWEGVINKGDTFIFDQKKAPGRQYVAEASNLLFIEDSYYDFILSSHTIEHSANPLQCLSEWIRVLKENGLFVLVVPHKDGTFDHYRPVTLLEYLIQDFETCINEDDMTHLQEILRLHDLSKDPGACDFEFFLKRSKSNIENRCLHHHVFDTRLAVEMVNHTGFQILTVELFHPYHIIILAKKIGRGQTLDSGKFRGINEKPCWHSPFPSDQLTHHKRV